MGFLIKKPHDAVGKSWPGIVVGLFAAFGGILFGYDTGTISGILAMPYWIRRFRTAGNEDIVSSEESLIVSILSAGTFLGALLAAPTADTLGRRLGLIFAAGIVFNLGVILQTISTSQPLFIAGRFFAGLGVGLVSVMVPLYQSETAPKWIRGAIVGAYQLAITIGLFLAAIVNNATQGRDDSGSYRIPIAIQFAWSLILVGGMFILPETPRFLVKRSRFEKAARSLSKLRRLDRSDPNLVEELNEIRANHEYELSLGKGTYLDCVKGTVGKRLFTGCALQALQQLSGVNFIFYYGTSYFKNAGFQDPFVIQVITNSVNVVSTLPGLYLVEKMGRRNLLLFGAMGMCVSQFLVAIIGSTAGTTDLAAQRAAIAFVCIFIFFFACSWGPVAWVVTGELFPLKVRAKCISITTASNWLFNFAIAYATPYLVDDDESSAQLGSKVFFIWGSCCAIAVAFTYFFIYETKNLTLEQVDELYNMVGKAWKSKKFRPAVRYTEVGELGEHGRGMSLSQAAEEVGRRKSSVNPAAANHAANGHGVSHGNGNFEKQSV